MAKKLKTLSPSFPIRKHKQHKVRYLTFLDSHVYYEKQFLFVSIIFLENDTRVCEKLFSLDFKQANSNLKCDALKIRLYKRTGGFLNPIFWSSNF